MDAKELKKLVKICQEMGVLELKTADLAIKLSPSSMRMKPQKDTEKLEDVSSQYTEDELLFWSASAPGLKEPNA